MEIRTLKNLIGEIGKADTPEELAKTCLAVFDNLSEYIRGSLDQQDLEARGQDLLALACLLGEQGLLGHGLSVEERATIETGLVIEDAGEEIISLDPLSSLLFAVRSSMCAQLRSRFRREDISPLLVGPITSVLNQAQDEIDTLFLVVLPPILGGLVDSARTPAVVDALQLPLLADFKFGDGDREAMQTMYDNHGPTDETVEWLLRLAERRVLECGYLSGCQHFAVIAEKDRYSADYLAACPIPGYLRPVFDLPALGGAHTVNFQALIDRLVELSEKARREGLLALEGELDVGRELAGDESIVDGNGSNDGMPDVMRRGVQLVVDGTDPEIVGGILQSLIGVAENLTRTAARVAAEAVLALQAGDNPRIVEEKLRAICAGANTRSLERLVKRLVEYSEKARREGILSLEAESDAEDDAIACQGLKMVCDGVDPRIARLVMCEMAERRCEEVELYYAVMVKGILELQAGTDPRVLQGVLCALVPFYPLVSEGKTVSLSESPLRKIVADAGDASSEHLIALAGSLRQIESLAVRYAARVEVYRQFQEDDVSAQPFRAVLQNAFEGLRDIVRQKIQGAAPGPPYMVERRMMNALFRSGLSPRELNRRVDAAAHRLSSVLEAKIDGLMQNLVPLAAAIGPSLATLHHVLSDEKQVQLIMRLGEFYLKRKARESEYKRKIAEDVHNTIRDLARELLGDDKRIGGLSREADPDWAIVRRIVLTNPALMEAVRKEAAPEVVREIKRQFIFFEDLARLDDRAIQKIMREIDPCALATAIAGADKPIQELVFRNMGSRAAGLIRGDIEILKPSLSESDVQEARMMLLNIVRKLEEQGEIIVSRE